MGNVIEIKMRFQRSTRTSSWPIYHWPTKKPRFPKTAWGYSWPVTSPWNNCSEKWCSSLKILHTFVRCSDHIMHMPAIRVRHFWNLPTNPNDNNDDKITQKLMKLFIRHQAAAPWGLVWNPEQVLILTTYTAVYTEVTGCDQKRERHSYAFSSGSVCLREQHSFSYNWNVVKKMYLSDVKTWTVIKMCMLLIYFVIVFFSRKMFQHHRPKNHYVNADLYLDMVFSRMLCLNYVCSLTKDMGL